MSRWRFLKYQQHSTLKVIFIPLLSTKSTFRPRSQRQQSVTGMEIWIIFNNRYDSLKYVVGWIKYQVPVSSVKTNTKWKEPLLPVVQASTPIIISSSSKVSKQCTLFLSTKRCQRDYDMIEKCVSIDDVQYYTFRIKVPSNHHNNDRSFSCG